MTAEHATGAGRHRYSVKRSETGVRAAQLRGGRGATALPRVVALALVGGSAGTSRRSRAASSSHAAELVGGLDVGHVHAGGAGVGGGAAVGLGLLHAVVRCPAAGPRRSCRARRAGRGPTAAAAASADSLPAERAPKSAAASSAPVWACADQAAASDRRRRRRADEDASDEDPGTDELATPMADQLVKINGRTRQLTFRTGNARMGTPSVAPRSFRRADHVEKAALWNPAGTGAWRRLWARWRWPSSWRSS